MRRLWLCGVSTCSLVLWPALTLGDDLAEPELARAIAEKVWDMFDRIDDLHCEFHSTMRPAGRKGLEKLQRWDNGFYAYKRGGYELIRYDETDAGSRPITYRYAVTPEALRGFREDAQFGARIGAVRRASAMQFRLQWAPGHYLPMGLFHTKVRSYLSSGKYVVRLHNGNNGDPELIAPVPLAESRKEEAAKPKQQLMSVLTLSRKHAMSPSKIEWYIDQVKEAETRLDLFEAAPGVWLAEHGTCTQLVGREDEFAHGAESEFWLEPGSVKINSGLQVALFNPEFPPGTGVADHLTRTEFTQGAPGGPASDLKALSAATQAVAPVNAKTKPPVAVAGWTGIDWVVASLAVVFAAGAGFGIVLLVRQTRNTRNARPATHPAISSRRFVR